MAIIDLNFDKHLFYDYKINKKQTSFEFKVDLKPEVKKWMSANSVRYQIMYPKCQICILDHQKAMMFKLRWM